MVMSQLAGDIMLRGYIPRTTVHDTNSACRLLAAQILEHLCHHYTKDDEYLKNLKKAMVEVMPQVLGEIVVPDCRSTVSKAAYSAPDADIEEARASSSSPPPQDNDEQQNPKQLRVDDNKLQEALVSLCAAIRDTWTRTDSDLARKLDEMAAKVYHTEQAQELLKKKA